MAPASKTPSFTISATPKKTVTAEIVGVSYQVKAPKTALLLAISKHSADKKAEAGAVSRDFETILKLMFGPVWVDVQARMEDPEDDLDLDHIFEAVEQLTEEKTGNPTS
jgi:hypothetical protein